MVYAEMHGRMGNQMCVYSFARYLQIKSGTTDPIAIDFSQVPKREDGTWTNYLKFYKCIDNTIEKKVVFSLIQRMVLKSIEIIRSREDNPGDKYATERFQDKTADFVAKFGLFIYRRGYHKFRIPRKNEDIFLSGLFEAHKYFDEVREQLIKDFKPIHMSEYARKLYDDVSSCESIAICVRRGDFASNAHKGLLDICTPDYFEQGYKLIKKRFVPDGKVFVFTEDIKWAKVSLSLGNNVTYITSGFSDDSVIDPCEMLMIMNGCKYFVISNSSYFWWAQYLANRDGKQVVAPSYWNNTKFQTDLYQDEWILINPDTGELEK